MATTDPVTGEPPISEPLRRVLEALIEGASPPQDAQAALTDAERAEVAALARTARLTHLTLQQPDPPSGAAEAALERAHAALDNHPTSETTDSETRSPVRQWWDRLLRRRNGE
jgi:hypothetical protein